MKKITLVLSIIALTFSVKAQKQIFESPNLQTEIAKHKIVAILPFNTKITYKKQPKNFNAEANKDQEKTMSKSI